MGHRGSTWCWSWSMSPATRCAILLRDKLRCVWCCKKLDPKATHESGLKPQLDHFVPRAQGGTHETTNLVTSCGDCNLEGEEARTPKGKARAENRDCASWIGKPVENSRKRCTRGCWKRERRMPTVVGAGENE